MCCRLLLSSLLLCVVSVFACWLMFLAHWLRSVACLFIASCAKRFCLWLFVDCCLLYGVCWLLVAFCCWLFVVRCCLLPAGCRCSLLLVAVLFIVPGAKRLWLSLCVACCSLYGVCWLLVAVRRWLFIVRCCWLPDGCCCLFLRVAVCCFLLVAVCVIRCVMYVVCLCSAICVCSCLLLFAVCGCGVLFVVLL